MSSSLAYDTSICDPFIKDEVVIMEDSPTMRDAVKEVIEDELGWQTRFVNNRTEAVQLVREKQAAYFILDNWIDDNKQEGFDTLEVIRNLDQKVFVSIITGHPDPNNRRLAERLKANLYKEKCPGNYRQDIKEIVLAMLKYKKQIIDSILDAQIAKISPNPKDIDIYEELRKLDITFYPNQQDPNIIAYEKAKQDAQWLAKYEGKYVAFVDGKLIDSDVEVNEKEILKRIREKYPDKPRLFTKVEKQDKIIDLPSSLWFDDLGLEF